MKELKETSEKDGAPAPQLAGMGTGNAGTASQHTQKIISAGSPWQRCGKITLENDTLKIVYESFGKDHAVYIAAGDLQRMVKDRWFPPAPVQESREQPDGAVILQKIGYACRSVSGKAIKINTTTSSGDLSCPWSSFLSVVNGRAKGAPISRLNAGECPASGPRVPASQGIREGLIGGF
jgi:hypothetical protein